MSIRHALVVGATRGLGLALAGKYLAEGWTVTATTIEPSPALEALAEANRGRLDIRPLDIVDSAAVASLRDSFDGRTIDVVHLREGVEQLGRENFSMSVWDKGRIMRAATEFDDRKVLRDANWSVGPDWSAREAFTREIIDGELVSHCWFRVDGTAVESETFTREMGRVSQRLECGRRVDYLGLHTILADVLVAAARGCTDAGVETSITCVTNSLADYGMGGYYAQCVSPLVTYVGPKEVSVRAGTFDGEHFKVRWSDLVPHYSDFWVLKEHFLPLRLRGAFGPVSYELAELDLG